MRVTDVVLNSIWYDPRVRKQILEYRRNGDEVFCVGARCSRYDAKQVAELPCPATIVTIDEKYNRELHSLGGKLKREKLRNHAIVQAIVATKPDLIHANDLNALIPAYKAAKQLNCKLVFDSHEIFLESYTGLRNMPYYWYLGRMEKKITKKVDCMICVSHAAADYFAGKYHIPKPMVITNCSLESDRVMNTEKHEGFEVLNHGGLYEGRGYDIMVEALPLLRDYPEIKLVIRGLGRLEEPLRKRAAELGDENFCFYSPVHVSEMIASAAKSSVGVAITEAICLNFELSVSNKLFEYASAGLPVILSDIPEHRYLNDRYHFGIILKENTPRAFADAVIKLYTDKKLYDSCAENARRLSREVNWESEFSKLLALEKTLLAGD